jgi:hypothetical protein
MGGSIARIAGIGTGREEGNSLTQRREGKRKEGAEILSLILCCPA